MCLGGCTYLYAFIGNFREFAFYNMLIDQATIYKIKNEYLEWRKELMGYYRFNSLDLAGE
jgi:hypothetical protein